MQKRTIGSNFLLVLGALFVASAAAAATVADERRVTILGPQAAARAGVATAAGDFDGDGHDDLLIGADGARSPDGSPSGAAFVVRGRPRLPVEIDLAVPSAGVLAIVRRGATGFLGEAVAAADLDGDRFDDAIVADPASDRVWILYGGGPPVATVDLAAGWPGRLAMLRGAEGSAFGLSLLVADLDVDGRPELVVGAPAGDGGARGRTDAGEVWVLHGRSSRLPAETELEPGLPGTTLVVGDVSGNLLGWSVAAGDLDGDGVPSLLLGAMKADGPRGGRLESGGAWIVADPTRPPVIDLASPPASSSVTAVYGASSFDRAGWSVAAGDVDDDGLADLVLGARHADQIGDPVGPGDAWVLFGTPGERSGLVDLSAPPTRVARIRGAFFGDLTATTLSVVDLDRDGRDEILLGATGADFGRGALWIVEGRREFPGEIWLGGDADEIGVVRIDGLGETAWSAGAADLEADRAVDLFFGSVAADGRPDRPGAGVVTVLRKSPRLETDRDVADFDVP